MGSTLVRNDAGGLVINDQDLVDLGATTEGASGATMVGIYNTKDFVDYFPPEVTNVNDALFDAKSKALEAYQQGFSANLNGIKKNVNFVTHNTVDGQPSNSMIIEADGGEPLPSSARLIGVSLRIITPWDNVGHSAITADVGFLSNHTGIAEALDLTVENPDADGRYFKAEGDMVWVMNSIEDLVPIITINSDDLLNTVTAGSFRVEIFYASV